MSDGIAEGIISRVSRLSDLDKVISSSSVRGYKGRDVDAVTVAREVDVRAVVMGNVTAQGENLRVYVELVDAENNNTLWGETYTRPRSAVYEMEETLSKEIADALGIQLTGEEGERLSKRYTENREAHEAYLKGRAEQARFTITGHQKAIQHFEEAIERDPNYAPAYAAMAYSYRALGRGLAAIPPQEAMPKAQEFATKALELDNTLGEAHAVLGDVQRTYYWDWEEAEREYKLAIELEPGSYEAPYGYAMLMSALGRHDEAVALSKRAQQLDPLNHRTRTGASDQFRRARRYELAAEQCQTIVDIDPNFPRGYACLALTYENMDLHEEAAGARHKLLILEGAGEEEVAGLLDAAASGGKAYWQWWLDYWKKREKQEFVSSYRFAEIYAALGEKDQAFEWLEKAYEERTFLFLKVDPYWDPLRDDPRFRDLLRRMNLTP